MIVHLFRTFAAVRICWQRFERTRRLDTHQQHVALLAGYRMARFDGSYMPEPGRRTRDLPERRSLALSAPRPSGRVQIEPSSV